MYCRVGATCYSACRLCAKTLLLNVITTCHVIRGDLCMTRPIVMELALAKLPQRQRVQFHHLTVSCTFCLSPIQNRKISEVLKRSWNVINYIDHKSLRHCLSPSTLTTFTRALLSLQDCKLGPWGAWSACNANVTQQRPSRTLPKIWPQFENCEKTSCNHHLTSVCQLSGREDEEFKICQPRPCLTVIVVHFALWSHDTLSCLACVYVHLFHKMDWAAQIFKPWRIFPLWWPS